jgi:hypothetical protein
VRNPISQLLQRRALHQAVRRAIDSGVGLYRMSWPAGDLGGVNLADDVLAWCRDVLSTMHRPYGVDSVSLALVAHDQHQQPLASSQFAMLQPMDFYGMGPAEAEARGKLQSWLREGIFSHSGVRLSAVLFSWGDLTQELVLAS